MPIQALFFSMGCIPASFILILLSNEEPLHLVLVFFILSLSPQSFGLVYSIFSSLAYLIYLVPLLFLLFLIVMCYYYPLKIKGDWSSFMQYNILNSIRLYLLNNLLRPKLIMEIDNILNKYMICFFVLLLKVLLSQSRIVWLGLTRWLIYWMV